MVQVPYNRHFAGARMKFPDVYHGLEYYFTINGGNQSEANRAWRKYQEKELLAFSFSTCKMPSARVHC